MSSPKTSKIPRDLESELATLRAAITEQQARLDALTTFARGTRDIAPVPAAPKTLDERLEALLREKPRTLVELAAELSLTPGATIVAMRRAVEAKKAFNLGTESSPRWFWRVGDEGPTQELVHAVTAIIGDRPMGMRELIDATGARGNRVSGVIVQLQRSGAPIQNVGTAAVARWFLAAAVGKR